MGSTAVAPAQIHPSWWSRAMTWVVHEATVVKNTIIKIANMTPEIQAEVDKVAPTAEELANLVAPGSGNILAHLVDVWSVAASTIHAAGDAASANGINVPFDATLVKDIKTFIPQVKAQMSPSASSTPATPTASNGPVA